MKIIGHRGAAGLAPENTLAAFRAALKVGVDGIELDLRVTADGTIVLRHDPYILDGTGKRLLLREHDLHELRALAPDLLTFTDFAQNIGTKTHLYIEVKPNESVTPIAKALRDRLGQGWQAKDLSICSFSQSTLAELHQRLPEIETVVIERWSSVRAMRRARRLGTKTLFMNQRWLWRGVLAFLHGRGYRVVPYGLSSPAKARQWQPYLYGIITDYPDRFSSTIKEAR